MNRKSCRSYSNKEIEYAKVSNIIEKATLYAPSACNHQMWHFIAIDNDQTKDKIQTISGSNFHFSEAPWLIIISIHLGWNHNKFAVIQSAAAASQMILKYANDEGISGCWNAGLGDTNKIKSLLKIHRNFECIGAITLGYPGELSKLEVKPPRRQVNDILSRNTFQRPGASIYPLKGGGKIIYGKALNHQNKYSIHEPQLWSYAQIGNLREYSVFAKSPFETTYISRRFKKEIKEELVYSYDCLKKLNNPETRICQILPFGGTHTNHLAKICKSKITIVEYSSNNIEFIKSRLSNIKNSKIDFFLIDKDGRFKTKNNKFNIIYNIQTIEQSPNIRNYLEEIKSISNEKTYIIFSIRNLISWYGLYYLINESKGQVSNFGPHRPLISILILLKIRKKFTIIKSYGISPLPSKAGQRVNVSPLKYFCRLFVIVCKIR